METVETFHANKNIRNLLLEPRFKKLKKLKKRTGRNRRNQMCDLYCPREKIENRFESVSNKSFSFTFLNSFFWIY